MVAQGTLDGVTHASAAPGGQNIPIGGTGPISLAWSDTVEGMTLNFTFAGRVDSVSPLTITALAFSWSTGAIADTVSFNQQRTLAVGGNEYSFGPAGSALGLDYTVWGNVIVH